MQACIGASPLPGELSPPLPPCATCWGGAFYAPARRSVQRRPAFNAWFIEVGVAPFLVGRELLGVFERAVAPRRVKARPGVQSA